MLIVLKRELARLPAPLSNPIQQIKANKCHRFNRAHSFDLALLNKIQLTRRRSDRRSEAVTVSTGEKFTEHVCLTNQQRHIITHDCVSEISPFTRSTTQHSVIIYPLLNSGLTRHKDEEMMTEISKHSDAKMNC